MILCLQKYKSSKTVNSLTPTICRSDKIGKINKHFRRKHVRYKEERKWGCRGVH